MEKSSNFMMVFRFEPNFDYQPTQEELNEQQQKWGAWIGGIAAQARLVSTNQLGFQGKQLHAGQSAVNDLYVADNKIIGGNMIVKAASLDQAAELAKGCPILDMGGVVEIRDIIPMNI